MPPLGLARQRLQERFPDVEPARVAQALLDAEGHAGRAAAALRAAQALPAATSLERPPAATAAVAIATTSAEAAAQPPTAVREDRQLVEALARESARLRRELEGAIAEVKAERRRADRLAAEVAAASSIAATVATVVPPRYGSSAIATSAASAVGAAAIGESSTGLSSSRGSALYTGSGGWASTVSATRCSRAPPSGSGGSLLPSHRGGGDSRSDAVPSPPPPLAALLAVGSSSCMTQLGAASAAGATTAVRGVASLAGEAGTLPGYGSARDAVDGGTAAGVHGRCLPAALPSRSPSLPPRSAAERQGCGGIAGVAIAAAAVAGGMWEKAQAPAEPAASSAPLRAGRPGAGLGSSEATLLPQRPLEFAGSGATEGVASGFGAARGSGGSSGQSRLEHDRLRLKLQQLRSFFVIPDDAR